MPLTNTQVELLKELRNRLQRGDISEIANKLGLSREHVSRSFNTKCDFFNDSIVEAAMGVITDREKRAGENLKKLKPEPSPSTP